MYAKRNSITIGVLWLLIMVISLYWYTHESKQIKELKVKNKELSQKLDGSMEIVQALNSVETQYQTLRMKWEQSPKKIIAADEPTFSINYLNWLVNNNNVPLEYDFELNNVTDSGDILTFTFTLVGEGVYYDLYRVIWFLAENPLLYQIESFVIQQQEDATNRLEFTMRIKGFSLKQQWDSGYQFSFENMKSFVQTTAFHDAFKPLSGGERPKSVANMFKREALKPEAKIEEKGLINITQCTLQAVARGRVYLMDGQGKLVTLKIGDKVRSGNLTNINQKKSEVEFTLNENGGTKMVILGLGYRK